jgi:hypothetical protein
MNAQSGRSQVDGRFGMRDCGIGYALRKSVNRKKGRAQ